MENAAMTRTLVGEGDSVMDAGGRKAMNGPPTGEMGAPAGYGMDGERGCEGFGGEVFQVKDQK